MTEEGVNMEKRNLGNLGIDVSLLGFGCMRFPTTKQGKIDEAEAEKMLDYAISKGVNYIDTAYPYHNGESEPFVGKVLKKYPRDSFYLATKLPVWAVNTLEDVDRIFEEQLQRLQTDHVDFYLMHAMNKERWDKMLAMGCVKRLEELQAEPSEGTHFFQNVTSLGCLYLTNNPLTGDGRIDWDGIRGMECVSETKHFVHVRSRENLIIKADGLGGRAVVMEKEND